MKQCIWTYWHQGFSTAPYIVQRCIRQLEQLHPEFEIHLLDQHNVYDFADRVPVREEVWNKMSLPHRSDLLRTQLLIKYGGIWLDPTVFCLLPLNDWLPPCVANGLFLFHRPGKDRITSNWFIAAEKNNELLQQLYDALVAYWNNNDFKNFGKTPAGRLEYWCKRIINNRSLLLSQLWLSPLFTKVFRLFPYMIYHYMFYYLIRTDAGCRAIYENMPKVSADGPHRLQRLGLLRALSEEGKNLVDEKAVPLQKLTWRIDPEAIPDNSHLSYLFRQ